MEKQNLQIITSVGYYATGSSAVTDYLREFSCCSLIGKGYYEIRFVQDPDGISDLAYHILDDNHRHNTSHAIKRFIKYLKYLNGSFYTKRYQKFFGKNFLKISMEYVNSITELKSKTWWHYDQIERGNMFCFLDILYGYFSRIIGKEGSTSLLKNREDGYYTSIEKDRFLKLTRNYLDRLFTEANTEKTSNVIVEQLVPPSNTIRYSEFFNDIKIIVVERDPRDVYISAKEIFSQGIIPSSNVKEFCEWYKITRAHRKHEKTNPNTFFVQFEDMVYHYDETMNKIQNFLNLDPTKHINKKKFFDPSRSINGTRMYLKNQKYIKDVLYIENELKEYLYNQYE